MWTPTTRRQHSRSELRYETDLTESYAGFWVTAVVRRRGDLGAR